VPRLSNREKLSRIRAGLWDVRAGLRLLAPLVSKPTPLGLQRIFSVASGREELEEMEEMVREMQDFWWLIEGSDGNLTCLKQYISAEYDSRDLKGEKQ
jgi:hypothetical protein